MWIRSMPGWSCIQLYKRRCFPVPFGKVSGNEVCFGKDIRRMVTRKVRNSYG